MFIEVLHVENCPHLPKTMDNLKEVILDLNINPEIKTTLIRNQDDANKFKFLGSTSVRVNGEDIVHIETEQYLLN